MSDRPSGPALGLQLWPRLVMAQLSSAVTGLGLLLGGGVVRAIWRRQFSFGAVLSAWLVAASLTLGLGRLFHLTQLGSAPPSVAALWTTALLLAACQGAVVGAIARKLAIWELYALMAAEAALATVLLGERGLPGTGMRAAPQWAQALGPHLLGPLWDRMVALWAPLALGVAVIASSLTLFVVGFDRSKLGRGRWGFALEWRLARRHLRDPRRGLISSTATITGIGVALGVGALICVTAVMSGYQDDIRRKILGTNAHLVVQKYGLDFVEVDEVTRAALAVPGVVAAAPFAFNEVMLQSGSHGVGVLLKGIDSAAHAQATTLAQTLCRPELPGCVAAGPLGTKLLAGWLAAPDGQKEPGPLPLVVGEALRKRLKLEPGAQVSLMTPTGMASLRGTAAKRLNFVVVGSFYAGLHEFDSHLVYTDLRAAQALLGMGAAISGVELRLQDPDRVQVVANQLLATLGHYPFRTLDWRQLNASIFTALALQKVVMALVLVFIVVVASFNIASTLFMAVVERAPHVAVLKSMGATDASIMQVFVLEGWLTGLWGTALGIVLGLGTSWLLGGLGLSLAADVYMVDALRVRVEPYEVGLVAMAALGICHLATLYPAVRAARGRPAKVLGGATGGEHAA